MDDDDPTDIYSHFQIDELTEEIKKFIDLGDVSPSGRDSVVIEAMVV